MLGLMLNSCTKSSPASNTSTNTTPAFTASMNGTATTFTGSGSSSSTYLTLTGTNTSSYTVTIYYKMPIQVGTAVTLGAPGGTYAYVTTSAGQFWETNGTSASGTITLSANTNNTVTGTFSFTGAPSSGTGNMVVTNGVINYITY